MTIQDGIAFAIVGLNLVWIARRFYRAQVVAPLSLWLLRRGRVKWALRVRGHRIFKRGCEKCER